MSEQKGQLVWKGSKYGYYGRYYITETLNGQSRRKRVLRALKDNGKPIFEKPRAQWRLDQLIAENTDDREAATRGETFREAAERVLAAKATTMITVKEQERRLKKFVYPLIGDADPRVFKQSTILDVLRSARDRGCAADTMNHIRTDISVVLGELESAEVVTRNVAKGVPSEKLPLPLPEVAERSQKVRAVLTDDELIEYLGWQHPIEQHRLPVRERQVMSCIARILGGLRTGDLHTITWDRFRAPTFERASVKRQKGRNLKRTETQHFEIPEMLRATLTQWWEENGKRTTGLIFPLLRGDEAGRAGRKHSSHAEAFREDLRRMWGIDQQVPVVKVRKNGRRLTILVWKSDVRPMTVREVELLTKTEETLPVDFHSWRRASGQSLADAGVNAQTSRRITAHSTEEAHNRYLKNTTKLITIPAASLPPALPPRIGHTASGTKRETPQKGTNDDDPDPHISRDILRIFTLPRLWVPAVGGSNPLAPTNSASCWAHRVPGGWRCGRRRHRPMLVPAGVSIVFGRARG